MSWQTQLQISYLDDSEPLDPIALKDQILAILDESDYHHDVFSGLDDVFDAGEATFNMHASALLNLIDAIAALAPECIFEARGLGEEFRDTWVREYRDGKAVFDGGPWSYD